MAVSWEELCNVGLDGSRSSSDTVKICSVLWQSGQIVSRWFICAWEYEWLVIPSERYPSRAEAPRTHLWAAPQNHNFTRESPKTYLWPTTLATAVSLTSSKMSVLETYAQYLDWHAIFIFPILFIVIHYTTRDPRRRSLPPQVRGWPIINQTFLQLKDDPTGLLRSWAREYGELFMTKSGTTTFIWLNSMESVKELFDRRSNIYSDRQPMPMALDAAR